MAQCRGLGRTRPAHLASVFCRTMVMPDGTGIPCRSLTQSRSDVARPEPTRYGSRDTAGSPISTVWAIGARQTVVAQSCGSFTQRSIAKRTSSGGLSNYRLKLTAALPFRPLAPQLNRSVGRTCNHMLTPILVLYMIPM